jgi:thymidylate synthase
MESQEKLYSVDNKISSDFYIIKSVNLCKPVCVLPSDRYVQIQQPNFEYQYANSLRRILEEGIEVENRTGINTLSVQHQYFFIQDTLFNFPRIKGKKVFPKMALKELLWMLNGRTDVQWLKDRGVNYWDEWANKEGTIGRSYGWQFRSFNGEDQLENMLQEMIKNPLGRRHIINLWNAADIDQMELPPCFYDFHFCCIPTPNNKNVYNVDLHVRSRSEDSFLGQPYDFMFVTWFLTVVCEYLNEKLSEVKYIQRNIHYTADDYHLYVNHKEQVKQYLENVQENKECLIESKCVTRLPKYKNITFIDQYIDYLDRDMKEIYVGDNCIGNDKIDFEYPQIKAEVAV